MHGCGGRLKGTIMGLLSAMWLPMAILLLRIPRDQSADIIGGKESIPHSRPFMAIIKGKKLCGGTLIKPNWVLTAAHCKLGESAKVILGAHSFEKPEPSKQIFKIARWIPYQYYNMKAKDNDLMLLQLDRSAKINRKVSIVKLTQRSTDIKAGTRCLVAGWGSIHNGSKKISDTLREVNVTVIERSICKKHYNSQPVITMNMVCAGDKEGRKDACTGDSGGPLICDGEQRAVVSFGRGCGDSYYPGVYARLTKNHLQWIRKTTGDNL